MLKDTVLVLSQDDHVVGSASKQTSHEFTPSQPRGILHRAFSVFLFDASTGELLLQKRAGSKITFPNVWTNTCCSHPLHGMDVDEVDGPDDVQNGTVPGVKAAAVRKLEHELGIVRGELPVDQFKFLTRLHYWAADTVTHGKNRLVHCLLTLASSVVLESFQLTHIIIIITLTLVVLGANTKSTTSYSSPYPAKTHSQSNPIQTK
jgi:isopentenyl-diphosphate delta-isomerase